MPSGRPAPGAETRAGRFVRASARPRAGSGWAMPDGRKTGVGPQTAQRERLPVGADGAGERLRQGGEHLLAKGQMGKIIGHGKSFPRENCGLGYSIPRNCPGEKGKLPALSSSRANRMGGIRPAVRREGGRRPLRAAREVLWHLISWWVRRSVLPWPVIWIRYCWPRAMPPGVCGSRRGTRWCWRGVTTPGHRLFPPVGGGRLRRPPLRCGAGSGRAGPGGHRVLVPAGRAAGRGPGRRAPGAPGPGRGGWLWPPRWRSTTPGPGWPRGRPDCRFRRRRGAIFLVTLLSLPLGRRLAGSAGAGRRWPSPSPASCWWPLAPGRSSGNPPPCARRKILLQYFQECGWHAVLRRRKRRGFTMTWVQRLGGREAITAGIVAEFRALSARPHGSGREEAQGAYLLGRLERMGLTPQRGRGGQCDRPGPRHPGPGTPAPADSPGAHGHGLRRPAGQRL